MYGRVGQIIQINSDTEMAKFNYDIYKTMEERAKWFAYYHHSVTLHMYDGLSYHEAHLTKVVDVAKRFIQWVPWDMQDFVLAACWLHDVIEDCRVTYNDLKEVFGEGIADIVYAVTNEKGKTRKERANNKYYAGIRTTPCATFVKLCDRIANIEAGVAKGGKMVEMYRKEQVYFVAQLDDNFAYSDMWQHIEDLLKVTEHEQIK
jgi:(p)ppGpp synthase/HD superfamily hydrolase